MDQNYDDNEGSAEESEEHSLDEEAEPELDAGKKGGRRGRKPKPIKRLHKDPQLKIEQAPPAAYPANQQAQN